MGTGTDVAMESGGVTLVKGDLAGIVRARKLSQATMRNIRQNLFFAFLYNSLGVPIAAGVLYPFFGLLLSPILAAAAMSLSSVSVITNSLRLTETQTLGLPEHSRLLIGVILSLQRIWRVELRNSAGSGGVRNRSFWTEAPQHDAQRETGTKSRIAQGFTMPYRDM